MKYLVFIFILLSLSISASAKEDKYLAALNNQLNYREASSYAYHTEQRNIEVGYERMSKDNIKRLLGNDTGSYRFLEIAVTNNSKFRIYINQIAILNGGKRVPKLDISDVHDAIDPGGKGNKDDMRDAALRNNLINKALPHAVLAPGETIQGIVFVKNKHMGGGQLLLQIQNLKRVAFLDFTVPLN